VKSIILVGGGGHCRSVIETITMNSEYSILGIVDVEKNIGKEVLGIPVIGVDSDLAKFYQKGILDAFITLGNIGSPHKRIELYLKLKEIGYSVPNIIDKSAIVSSSAELEEGVFVGKNAIVNVSANISTCSIINTGAIIEHDCKLGKFVHISPGAVLSGNVLVEKNTHIGSNATIINNIKIGENCMIGAGSVVTKDIKSNSKAYGNPCKVISEYFI